MSNGTLFEALFFSSRKFASYMWVMAHELLFEGIHASETKNSVLHKHSGSVHVDVVILQS
jgi:hypothetical protein